MPISDFNPYGTGYTVSESTVQKSSGLDTDYNTNRTYKIQNNYSRNPINKKAVAYKIHAPPFQKMVAHPSSFHHKRAEFADHNIYVTKYHDDELYAGGTPTNLVAVQAFVRGLIVKKMSSMMTSSSGYNSVFSMSRGLKTSQSCLARSSRCH